MDELNIVIVFVLIKRNRPHTHSHRHYGVHNGQYLYIHIYVIIMNEFNAHYGPFEHYMDLIPMPIIRGLIKIIVFEIIVHRCCRPDDAVVMDRGGRMTDGGVMVLVVVVVRLRP